MLNRSRLFVRSLSFAVIAVPILAQQQQPTGERFTTGPPDEPARLPTLDDTHALDVDAPWRPEFLVPDGLDIRANQVTSSAQNETSLAVNPFDRQNWVGVANDYSPGTVTTGWYTTLDGGATWTTGAFPFDPGFSFCGDPAVCFDVNGNPVILCMMYAGPGGSRVTAFRSTDKGLTWSASIPVDLDPGNDKPQVECDHSNGPGRGRLTVAWDRFGTGSGDHIHVSSSTDGGLTWTPQVRINDATSTTTIAPDITFGPNSEIYVAWADRGGLKRAWVDRSLDGGATWNTDVIAAPFTAVPSPIPGSSFRMFDIFSISADVTSGPHSGNVYVAYHTWTGSDAQIRLATSSDGGLTFPLDTLVNASDLTNRDQVMPGIVVDWKGNVNVSFYDRRLDPVDRLLWTWVGRSSDGGASFVNYRVSDVGWNHVPTEFSFFIGDYQDIDADERNVYPFWCDGRSGSQDVYTDRVNLDLHTNVPSLSAGAGGSVSFTINVGPNLAGKFYALAASASGTAPGTLFSGYLVPLNGDVWTQRSITLANTVFFTNNQGTLDATGSATASFNTVGPRPFLAGLTLDWVVLVLDPLTFQPLYATAPTRVTFTP
ncbi:MAG: sialidase family protein [Planctomycetota bacterium]